MMGLLYDVEMQQPIKFFKHTLNCQIGLIVGDLHLARKFPIEYSGGDLSLCDESGGAIARTFSRMARTDGGFWTPGARPASRLIGVYMPTV